MIIEVKKYECKFIHAPMGRGKVTNKEKMDGIKGEKLYSDGNVVHELGDVDGEKGSPTYGQKILKPNKTYVLDMYQIRQYGEMFEIGKEVDGYIIDDKETDDESNSVTQEEIRKREGEKAAKAEAAKKESEENAKEQEEANKEAAERDAEITNKEKKEKAEAERARHKVGVKPDRGEAKEEEKSEEPKEEAAKKGEKKGLFGRKKK